MAEQTSFLKKIFSRSVKNDVPVKISTIQLPKEYFKVIYNTKEQESDYITEALKSQISNDKLDGILSKNKDVKKHPFDFQIVMDLYIHFGPLKGVIDKYKDMILGPGFHVVAKDPRVEDLLNKHMIDVQFYSILSNIITTALTTGTLGLEMGKDSEGNIVKYSVIEPTTYFIKQNDQGEVTGYCQITKSKDDPIEFDLDEIANFTIGKVGTSPYGQGIAWATVPIIEDIVKSRKDMHTILHRKANSPLWAKLGKEIGGTLVAPTDDVVKNFGQELEFMNNKTEFATGPLVDLKVIDYGQIGEKFTVVLENDWRMFFSTLQVPQVLLGEGNIAEGLADVQLDAFDRRIRSLQQEIEKVIETQIFSQILKANGFEGQKAEFVWGLPSNIEKNLKLNKLTEILKLQSLDPALRLEIEKEVAILLDIEFVETPEEERNREEEEEPQPSIPGFRTNQSMHVHEITVADLEDDEFQKDYTISEFIRFNYLDYIEEILGQINDDGFDFVRAKTGIEEIAGKLTESQVEALRDVLREGLTNSWTVREIANEIERNVIPGDLFRLTEDGQLVLDSNGNKILRLSAKHRSVMISRTELVRISNIGAIRAYENQGVERVRWVSALSQRTCPICEELNGSTFSTINAIGILPVHVFCRCRFVPIIEGLS